jgi:hypothetical protein
VPPLVDRALERGNVQNAVNAGRMCRFGGFSCAISAAALHFPHLHVGCGR